MGTKKGGEMIAYIIKNKRGRYFCGYDPFLGNIFSTQITDGLNTATPTKRHCLAEMKEHDLKDCKVVNVEVKEIDE